MIKVDWKNKDYIQSIVASSRSFSETLRNLGLKIHGSSYRKLHSVIAEFQIDVFHLEEYKNNYTFLKENGLKNRKFTIDELLIEHSPHTRNTIKRRLLVEQIIPYKCAACENDGMWAGKRLSLQLEHKNGINDDYRIENLEFLCPNCHSQTSTFCGKNIRKAR